MSTEAPTARVMRICLSPGMLRMAFLGSDASPDHLIGYRVFFPYGDIIPGMVFMGRVTRIDPEIDAAFVDIGANQAALLPAKAAGYAPGMPTPSARGIAGRVTEGQRLLLQVTRAPETTRVPGMPIKGARVTTRLRFAGRHLVHTPCEPGIAFSNELAEEKRDGPRDLVAPHLERLHGAILRAAAAKGDAGSGTDLAVAIDGAAYRWQRVIAEDRTRDRPGPIAPRMAIWEAVVGHWNDAGMPRPLLEIVGDSGQSDPMTELTMAAATMGTRIAPTLSRSPAGAQDDFDSIVLPDLDALLEPNVPLPGGGSILIGHTPALTAIDVNTGATSTGLASAAAEITHATNLEAATMIARVVAARDIGGRVVVDFIGMEGPGKKTKARRQEVQAALRSAFRTDGAAVDISEIGASGLLVINRQNSGLAIRERLTAPCARCAGDGRVAHPLPAALDALRAAIRQMRHGTYRRPAVRAHPAVVAALDRQTDARAEAAAILGHDVAAVADPEMRPGAFEIVEEPRT